MSIEYSQSAVSHPHTYTYADTALAVLVILEAVMLFAMFSRAEPHPPFETPLFGMGPFLGACISLAVAALMLGAHRTAASRIACLIALLPALIAFGPQKWFDPAFPKIWPALILAQVAIAAVAWACLRATRSS